MTWFSRPIWSKIHFHTILQQYADRPEVFDDAYFEALQRRRDSKFALQGKLLVAYLILMLAMALSVFGLSPEISQFGINLKVDPARDLLLAVTTSISFICAMIHNDLTLMQAMLRARTQHLLATGKSKLLELQVQAGQARDMMYTDSFGDYLPTHLYPFEEQTTRWNTLRVKLIGALAAVVSLAFIISFVSLQLYVVWLTWTNPALLPWLSRLICIYALSANLLWIVMAFPYKIRSIAECA
jgi:hypothetical protein